MIMSDRKARRGRFFVFMPLFATALLLLLAMGGFFFGLVRPQYYALVSADAERDALSLAGHLINEHMEAMVGQSELDHRRQLACKHDTFNLWKVRFLDTSGKIIFSSDDDEVGERASETHLMDLIATRNVQSRIVRRSRATSDLRREPVHVVETCVPVVHKGQNMGLLEVCLDVSEEIDSQEQVLFMLSTAFGGIAVVLLVVIGLICWRVHLVEMRRNRATAALEAANAELAMNAELFRGLYQNLNCGVAVYQPVDDGRNFRIVDFNHAAELSTRVTKEQVIGKLVTEAFPGVGEMGLLKVLTRVSQTREAEEYVTHKYQDDRIRMWVDNHVYWLPSGQVVAVFDDLTKQKATEEFFSNIVRATAGCGGQDLFELIATSMSVWLNARASLIGELIDEGRTVRTLAMTVKGELQDGFSYALHGTPCERAVAGGICVYPSGVCSLFPEDTALAKLAAIGYVGVPIHNRDGEAVGVIAVITSEAVELPQNAKDILTIVAGRASLEIERLKRERELEKQQELAIRGARQRSVGEMAGGMAHEFNQPLSAIRGFAENLLISKQRGWPVTDEELVDKMGDIVGLTERMADLIEHVRAFSRDADSPELVLVNLKDVLASTLMVVSAQLRAHCLELDISYPDDDTPAIVGNPFLLEEVFLGLVRNCRDALQPCGRADKRITISLRVVRDSDAPSKGVAQVEFMDNGTGIPADVIQRVCDPFFTTKGPDRGIGLGLTTAQRVVSQLGGELVIQSEVGEGTTVTMHFPLAQEQDAELLKKMGTPV